MSDDDEIFKLCPICHCKLYVRDFYRFNSKNKVKRYYKVCNWCIVKSRNRQNKIKEFDKDKEKYDDIMKKMSHAVYIEDGEQKSK